MALSAHMLDTAVGFGMAPCTPNSPLVPSFMSSGPSDPPSNAPPQSIVDGPEEEPDDVAMEYCVEDPSQPSQEQEATAAEAALQGEGEETVLATLAEAEEARQRANQLMKDGEFERGIDLYSAICKFYIQAYGPHAEQCAIHYYEYGEALLYQMQETETNVDGKEDNDDDEPHLAVEALEVAMQLYTKQVEALRLEGPEAADRLREAELQLATVHCKLGDLALELDSLGTVLGDYSQCLALRAKYLDPGDRRLSEVHYQLGRAHEQLADLPAALECYRRAQAALASHPDTAKLAAEVALKVEDLAEEVTQHNAEMSQTKSMLQEAIAGIVPSLAGAQAALTPMEDLTPLQLQTLPVPQLRALASRYAVDVTGCCEKADLVERLLAAAQSKRATTVAPTEGPAVATPTPAATALAPRKRVRPTAPPPEAEDPAARQPRLDGAAMGGHGALSDPTA